MPLPVRFICGVFVGLATCVASAQVAPAIAEKSLKSSTMDGQAKQEAAAFVQAASTLLRSGDPTQVRRGREAYTRTFSRSDVSPAYRTAFAAMALPSLKEVVATGNPLQGINAIESMKAFNSPDAVSALVEQASPTKQKSASLRLVAASGLGPAIRQTDLNTAQADSIVKGIATYIDRETDWMTLAYEIQALEVMSTSPRTSKDGQATARVLEASAIDALVSKLRKGTAAPDTIRAVNRSLSLILTDQLGATDAAAMVALKKALEPSFAALRELAKSPPAGSDAAPFTQAARLAETLQRTQLDTKPAKPGRRPGATSNSPATR